MSIESKIPAEELNIKSLNLEQPEENNSVDFEKLVSLVDWDDFKNQARDEWEKMTPQEKEPFKLEGEFAKTLYKISLINPEVYNYLCDIMKINEHSYDTVVKEELENGNIVGGRWFKNLWTAVAVKSLYPEKHLNLGLSEQVWEDMKKQLDFERDLGNYGHSLVPQMALGMRAIFPKRWKELGLEKKDWQGMNKELDKYKQHGHLRSYYLQMAYMKLLFPEHQNNFLSIVSANMREIKAEILEQSKFKHSDNAFDILFALKLITSEKVVFSHDGMEIIMPHKSDFQTASQLPETKKF